MAVTQVGPVVRVMDRESHHPLPEAQVRRQQAPAPASPAPVAHTPVQASEGVLREEALVRIAHDFRSAHPPRANPLQAIALYKATARVQE